jgi:hypothetical protein
VTFVRSLCSSMSAPSSSNAAATGSKSLASRAPKWDVNRYFSISPVLREALGDKIKGLTKENCEAYFAAQEKFLVEGGVCASPAQKQVMNTIPFMLRLEVTKQETKATMDSVYRHLKDDIDFGPKGSRVWLKDTLQNAKTSGEVVATMSKEAEQINLELIDNLGAKMVKLQQMKKGDKIDGPPFTNDEFEQVAKVITLATTLKNSQTLEAPTKEEIEKFQKGFDKFDNLVYSSQFGVIAAKMPTLKSPMELPALFGTSTSAESTTARNELLAAYKLLGLDEKEILQIMEMQKFPDRPIPEGFALKKRARADAGPPPAAAAGNVEADAADPAVAGPGPAKVPRPLGKAPAAGRAPRPDASPAENPSPSKTAAELMRAAFGQKGK